MAFAVVKSKTPTGLGQVFNDCEGLNTYKCLQTFVDFGIPCELVIKNNFGRISHKWYLIWAKDVTRQQGKEIIRTLLNQLEVSQKFEMFICSFWQNMGEENKSSHIAFDLDDSHQNGKLKIIEAKRRWRIIKKYNYRAPPSIKYDMIQENYETCDVDYRQLRFISPEKEKG
jgi:hypothetical protein